MLKHKAYNLGKEHCLEVQSIPHCPQELKEVEEDYFLGWYEAKKENSGDYSFEDEDTI